MSIHNLKTVNPYFQSIWDEEKTFEIRKDDRGFAVGDTLILWEWVDDEYTGRRITCLCTYVLTSEQFEGLAPGYVCIAIDVISRFKPREYKNARKESENN